MAPTRVSRVILGIDLGSTSTRACLYDAVTGEVVYVENKSRHASCRFENGDFSSHIYPFDTGPLYLGVGTDSNRQSISGKYGLYPLAKARDTLLEQYHLVERLMTRAKDERFLERLRQGLKALFSQLQGRVAEVCRSKHYLVEYIGLSIPAQWGLDFEDVYRDIIATVFSHPPPQIYFHTETVALVHFLFKKHLTDLKLDGEQDSVRVVLFLDFGGHNMNGCIFNLYYGAGEDVSFYQIDEPFGAGGGIEQWEYNLGKQLALNMARAGGKILLPIHERRFIDDFHKAMVFDPQSVRDGFFIDCPGPYGHSWRMSLDADSVQAAFDSALAKPLDLAAKRIAKLSGYDVSPQVVVSGGTARSAIVQARLRSMCKEASLPDPLFTEGFEIRYDSVKIAQGAAYATGNRLTVGGFLDRGAAFGLQRKQWAPRNANKEELWDNTATFLVDQLHEQRAELTLTAKDELRIICDPFYRAGPANGSLDILKCYDIINLGAPGQGSWQYTLSYLREGDTVALSLQSSKHRKGHRREHLAPRFFPLCFDGGANCVNVGVRDGGIVLDADNKEGDTEDDSGAEDSIVAHSLEAGRSTGSMPYDLTACSAGERQAPDSAVCVSPVRSPGVKPSGSLQHIPIGRAIRTGKRSRPADDSNHPGLLPRTAKRAYLDPKKI